MNEQYTTVSVTANIIQSVTDVMLALDPANVEVPKDQQELTHDIQAAIGRLIGGR